MTWKQRHNMNRRYSELRRAFYATSLNHHKVIALHFELKGMEYVAKCMDIILIDYDI